MKLGVTQGLAFVFLFTKSHSSVFFKHIFLMTSTKKCILCGDWVHISVEETQLSQNSVPPPCVQLHSRLFYSLALNSGPFYCILLLFIFKC